MPRIISRELLLGFVEEARSYLPDVARVVQTGRAASPADIEAAYRRSHTIKGAASMVGLVALSHVAALQEEVLEEVWQGRQKGGRALVTFLKRSLAGVEECLAAVERAGAVPPEPTADDRRILTDVVKAYRRMKRLPAAGDDEMLTQFLRGSTEPSAADPSLGSMDFDAVPPAQDGLGEARPAGGSLTTSATQAGSLTTSATGDVPPLEDPASLDPEFAAIFRDEADETIQQIYARLGDLERDPADAESQKQLRRLVHNLKGAAGTVGFGTPAAVAHRLEDALDAIAEAGAPIGSDLARVLYRAADVLSDLARMQYDPEAMTADVRAVMTQIGALDAPAPMPVVAARAVDSADVRAVGELPAAPQAVAPAATTPAERLAPTFIDIELGALPGRVAATGPAAPATPAQPAASVPAPESGDAVRVAIGRLDEMVRLVSELVVNRTAFEQRMADLNLSLSELRLSLGRLRNLAGHIESEYETKFLGRDDAPWNRASGANSAGAIPPALSDRFRGTRRVEEFDELEFDRYTDFHIFSRSLSETANDIDSVGTALGNLIGEFDALLNRQSILSRELQDRLMKSRMVPLATISSRLRRAVRNVAELRGRNVATAFEGESTQLDKTVVEALCDPLVHLLRNAVDHGVEPPETRRAQGKPEQATVRVRAFHQGTHVVLQVADDGAGLDVEKIRAEAVRRGLVSGEEAERLTSADWHAFVFAHGFSTAADVTEVSGRGLGLDAVRAAVHRLKGTIAVESEPGRGTTFTIRLPMTLAITRALLVRAGADLCAIPMPEIAQIARVSLKGAERIGDSIVLRSGDALYPLHQLSDLLRRAPRSESPDSLPVLFLAAGDRHVAVAVDQIVAAREIVVKNLGSHLRRVRGLIGATLMGDGTVVPILNTAELLEAPPTRRTEPVAGRAASPADRRDPVAWSILIVDDSVSVRRVAANLLRQRGWESRQARDGVEALELLQQSPTPPDLILLDVEMPRMDGYEFLSTIRALPEFRELPVIMVTSRSGDKHRGKATDLGASDYIVKPFDDERLLNLIEHHIRRARSRVMA